MPDSPPIGTLIDRFAERLEEQYPGDFGALAVAVAESSALKRDLLRALAAAPHADALVAARRRLGGVRERLKDALAAALLAHEAGDEPFEPPHPPDEPGDAGSGEYHAVLADATSAASAPTAPPPSTAHLRVPPPPVAVRRAHRARTAEELIRELSAFPAPESADADSARAAVLHAWFEECHLAIALECGPTPPRRELRAALMRAVDWLAAWARTRGAAGVAAVELGVEDLARRLDRPLPAMMSWQALLEASLLDRILDLAAGRPHATLIDIHTRLGWMRREAPGTPWVGEAMRMRYELIHRRLLAVIRRIEQIDATPIPATATLRDAEEMWELLVLGSDLSAEAEEFLEELGERKVAALQERRGALKQAAARHDEVEEILRRRLRAVAATIPDDDLEQWRRQTEVRADQVLSLVAARRRAWRVEALGDLRFDLKWIDEEYRRRIEARAGSEPPRPSTPPTPPTSTPPVDHLRASAGRIESVRAHVRTEHREEMLQARVERLIGKTAAAVLDALVVALILAVLILLVVTLSMDLEPEVIHFLDVLDAWICGVLLFDFFFKMALSESWWWYFRRRWFTHLLPSIPYGLLLEPYGAIGQEIGAVGQGMRSLRLVAIVRTLRFARLLFAMQYVADRLVRRFRELLDIDVRVFGDLPARRAQRPHSEALHDRTKALESQALLATSRALRTAEAADAARFWQSQLASLRARLGELTGEDLLSRAEAERVAQRSIRLEEIIETLRDLDAVRVEEYLGPNATRQAGTYLAFLGPVVFPLLGMKREAARALRSSDLLAAAGRRLAVLLDTLYNRVIGFFRDLYGIVSGAEFLSFTGGFLSRIFRRHQNRLILGVAIVVIGFLMIKSAESRSAWGVSAVAELARPMAVDEVRALVAERHPFIADGLDAETADATTTLRLSTSVRVGVFRDRTRAQHAFEEALRDGIPEDALRRVSDVATEDRPALLVSVGGALQRSFGAVLLILGIVGFLAVSFGNWLTRRAGRVVDELMRVSEAQFINLMKDYKLRRANEDIALLVRRVLRPELPLSEVLEGEGDAGLFEALRAHVGRSVGLPARENMDGMDDLDSMDGMDDMDEMDKTQRARPAAAPPSSSSSSSTPSTSSIQSMPSIRSMPSISSISSVPPLDRVALMYRDYLDGAVLHRSDVKTTEQLLGNLAVQEAIARLGLAEQRRRLERLDLAKVRSLFGPYIWFTFITNSIGQKIGAKVLEYGRQHGTSGFTALDFLFPDAAREEQLAARHGPDAIARLRADRRDIIRSVFGTYPMRERALNLFRFYRHRYEGGMRIFRLPIDVLWLGLRGLLWGPRRFLRALREFLHPDEAHAPPSPYATFEVARRKVFRMRKPVFVAALELRARFDLAYLGAPMPSFGLVGCEGFGMAEDLARVTVGAAFAQKMAALGEEYAARIQRFGALLPTLGLPAEQRRDPARARLWLTAYCIDDHDVATLLHAEERWEEASAVALRRHGWPEGHGPLRRLWHRLGRAIVTRLGTRETPDDRALLSFLEARGDIARTSRDLRHLARAYALDCAGLRRLVEVCLRRDAAADPRGRAIEILERLGGEAGRFQEQLLAVRTVQTMALLDLMNDQRIVAELGGFDAPSAPRATAPDGPAVCI